MIKAPQPITTISNPNVADTYVKHAQINQKDRDVLVIEVSEKIQKPQTLEEILPDLTDMTDKATKQAGKFDYVDIRLN